MVPLVPIARLLRECFRLYRARSKWLPNPKTEGERLCEQRVGTGGSFHWQSVVQRL